MRGLVLALAAAAALPAQIKFTRMESPHFELFTDGAKGRATDILEHFERVRSFFVQTIAPYQTDRKPRVVVLNSAKSFAAFVDRKTTAAYYIGLPHRDMIVIGPGGKTEDTNTITHEYIHLLVHQAEMSIPLWMNEGIAEVYSTLQPVGQKMRVGTPIPYHLRRLQRDWMDVRQVLKAETYGSEEHVGLFYSMSWAIAHMLLLEDDLRPKWPRFLGALQSGTAPDVALRKAYGLTPQQLEQHVQGYIRGKTVNVVEFNFKWEEWKDKPEMAPASVLDNELAMIDLHLSGKNYKAAAEHAARLTQQNPRSAAAWETLAAARIYEQDKDGTREAVRGAFANGSSHPGLLAMGASLLAAERSLAKQMIDRALTADPAHFESRLQLVAWHLYGRDYEAAYQAAKAVKHVPYRDAARFAALYNRAAKESGHAPVAEPQAPSAGENGVVTGQLVEVACEDSKQVLIVQTAESLRQIEVDRRQALMVGGEDVKISCGPQKRKRRVRVGVSGDGFARKLEFLP